MVALTRRTRTSRQMLERVPVFDGLESPVFFRAFARNPCLMLLTAIQPTLYRADECLLFATQEQLDRLKTKKQKR